MGRIQSSIGLVTGMDIESTVKSLIDIAARPRDLLQDRTDQMGQKQVAITKLSALLLSVQYITDSLGKDDLFTKRTATSSNSGVVSAEVTGDAAKGTYQFTPLRTATSHQLLGSGLKSRTDALDEGKLTFRFGDGVLRDENLDLFGGGAGITRGKIRITDRSGASAEIDLTGVQDIGDVLDAINQNADVNVTAVAVGDGLRLVDNTGQAVSNLMVQEVSGGTTAASLGLDGINVAADTADGRDMLWLTRDLDLQRLNDGNGVRRDTALDDIRYQLRDGTEGTIDLSPILPGGSDVDAETTLGDILDAINAAEPGKLKVEIAADGDRLVLTDLTEGAGTFSVESLFDSDALADLGLDGAAVGGTITGRRILSGANTVLLSSLDGGKGLEDLGTLQLTDRTGATATVDLAGAETLDDVLARINESGVGVTARVNDASNGILLTDTTGNPTGNLIVASGDATQTAEKLQIAGDSDAGRIDSGDLHLQVVGYDTALDDLNGGQGVQSGKIRIIDSAGRQETLAIGGSGAETIGEVIRAINRLDVDVRARLNDTGDGILIEDLAAGAGKLQVLNDGNTTTAEDLHLAGDAVTVSIDGQDTQVVDGSTAYTIELDGATSLDNLVEKIMALDAGVQATILKDSSNNPYHLALSSEVSGRAGRLIVDASQLGFSMKETVRGQDALMAVGQTGDTVIASDTNVFNDALTGVSLEIKSTSTTPVTVTVKGSSTDLVANVRTFVENYNALREAISELTAYDADTDTASILTGDSTALRLETDLNRLLSGSFLNDGTIRSLGELGVDFTDDGTLDFDEAKFQQRYTENPEGVRAFFTQESTGFSAKFKTIAERLTGSEFSTLDYRITVLANKIESNERQIEIMNERLNRQQELLYAQFYQMESAVSKMQSNLSVLDSIQNLNKSE